MKNKNPALQGGKGGALVGLTGFWGKLRNIAPTKSKADLSVYFIDEPQRYVRFKHACIGDYTWGNVNPSLSGCSCPDFKKTGLPCYHMYTLALKSGVYDELFKGHEDLIAKFESLSPSAFSRYGLILYRGYVENAHKLSELGRYWKQIEEGGLISVDGDLFQISDEVKNNLYFVIHYIMSDPRFRKYRNHA